VIWLPSRSSLLKLVPLLTNLMVADAPTKSLPAPAQAATPAFATDDGAYTTNVLGRFLERE
jgi:hypothetical protein